MALETGTFINSLNAANPTTNDPKSQGDDHLRLIKSAIKNTFTAITGAINATHTEINFVQGVTSAIQTQLNNLMATKGEIAGQAWTGIHTFVTQAALDSTTKAATTAYTDLAVAVEKTRAQLAESLLAPLLNPNFTGSPKAPTPVIGDSSTNIATTEFVASTAFSAVLPAQTGNGGKVIVTNGANAYWDYAINHQFNISNGVI
jgi:hypothetical protein